MSKKSERNRHVSVPGFHCPNCLHYQDDATNIDTDGLHDDVKPKPGDCGICAYCGLVFIYSDKLKARPFTAEEFEELSKNPYQVRLLGGISNLLRSIDASTGRKDNN